MQLPNMDEGSVPPLAICVVHHLTDELFVQQYSVTAGETTSPVHETKQQPKPQGSPYSNLVDMWLTGQPCIDCHPQNNGRYRIRGLAPRTAVLVGA
jgi:hypothetical protein